MRAVLSSIEGVPEGSRDGPGYQKALDLMAHIAIARDIWLARILRHDAPGEIFPTGWDSLRVRAMWDRVEGEWREYLGGLTDEGCAREMVYRNMDGRWWRNTVGETLMHVCTHGFYHRGQVAVLVRACGGEPAQTGLMLHVRRPG